MKNINVECRHAVTIVKNYGKIALRTTLIIMKAMSIVEPDGKSSCLIGLLFHSNLFCALCVCVCVYVCVCVCVCVPVVGYH